MARTNVDDEWYADPLERRAALIQAMMSAPVNIQWMADGAALTAWRLSQKYWKDGGKLIPEDVWRRAGLEPLIGCDLAVRHPDGIYVRGTEDRTEWLRQKVEAGKKRAASERDEHGRFQPKHPAESPALSSESPADAGLPLVNHPAGHQPPAPALAPVNLTSPPAPGDGAPTAPAKTKKPNKAKPDRCTTWDQTDPIAKVLANLSTCPGYQDVFDAPKDKELVESLMLRHVITLHEMIHVTADLAIWAIDPTRVVKNWRSTLNQFCKTHVRSRPQAKGVTPLDRRIFDY